MKRREGILNRTSRSVVLACLMFAPLAQADDAPIDEVVVRATRTDLVKLARQVRMAEFRFYDRYNELNTQRDYAVTCNNEATTGSRFTWDSCQPVFQEKARVAEGRGFADVIQSAHAVPRGGVAISATPRPPASMAITAGRPGFQQHMIDVTRRNPDLIKLLNEYDALLKQYEAAYRKINGRKAPADEKVEAGPPDR